MNLRAKYFPSRAVLEEQELEEAKARSLVERRRKEFVSSDGFKEFEQFVRDQHKSWRPQPGSNKETMEHQTMVQYGLEIVMDHIDALRKEAS